MKEIFYKYLIKINLKLLKCWLNTALYCEPNLLRTCLFEYLASLEL